jgi:hypothetical protein
MTLTRNIVHVAPNGRVDELGDVGELRFLARTFDPSQRERFATLGEAIAHMRAMHQAYSGPGVLAIAEDSVRKIERVIADEMAHGTRPGDGTPAGRILASELKWVAYQRGQLANARGEAHSWYDPIDGGRNGRP